jgi:hypothetical protein
MWASLYRSAQQSPAKSVCVNPEDDPEEHTYLHANNIDFLLILLERFAETGTFQDTDHDKVGLTLLRWTFNRLRESMSYSDALATLAQQHSCAERTIERRLSPDKS